MRRALITWSVVLGVHRRGLRRHRARPQLRPLQRVRLRAQLPGRPRAARRCDGALESPAAIAVTGDASAGAARPRDAMGELTDIRRGRQTTWMPRRHPPGRRRLRRRRHAAAPPSSRCAATAPLRPLHGWTLRAEPARDRAAHGAARAEFTANGVELAASRMSPSPTSCSPRPRSSSRTTRSSTTRTPSTVLGERARAARSRRPSTSRPPRPSSPRCRRRSTATSTRARPSRCCSPPGARSARRSSTASSATGVVDRRRYPVVTLVPDGRVGTWQMPRDRGDRAPRRRRAVAVRRHGLDLRRGRAVHRAATW